MAAKGEGEASRTPRRRRRSFNQDHAPWSNIAFHLAPRSSWEAAQAVGELRPDGFDAEGFVHLTLGLDQLLVPANAYYAGDPRPHVALTVDLDAVGCEVRFDADPPLYPHAYGPLPLAAIREVRSARRDGDGTFTGWGRPDPVGGGTLGVVAAPMVRPGSVDVLLFDLGGVVVDIDFRRCMARWASSAGREIEEVASRFTFDAAYEEHERGALDAAGYFASLREALSVDLTDEDLLAGWNDIYVGATAGMGALLARASIRFPLYAFTNSNPSHQAVWSERFAVDLEVFTSTFVSSDIGHRKPDRVAFDVVAAAIGVPPAGILFFDDTRENVVGALEAGMQAVHVTSTESVRGALAQLGV